jgi:ribosomal protein L7/L12
MKRIIECTKQEVISLIKESQNVDEVIINESLSSGKNYVEAICQVIHVDFPITYATNNKIAAIKKLREYVPGLGLCESKAAVENPQKAIETYLRTRSYFTY